MYHIKCGFVNTFFSAEKYFWDFFHFSIKNY